MTGVDVGVDIGGTKTHLRIHDGSGGARDLIVRTAEWRVRDWQRDADTVLALARRLAGGSEISAIAVGAHGCDDASECDGFQAAFAERATFPVTVVNDAELLPAALGYENQIGLVAGTGSIAVCRDGERGMMVAGGWGWVIGDEGSAAGLMREAARAVTLHLDGGGEPSEPLLELLLEALAIRNAARIGSCIAALGGSAELGRHALVFEAERRGSRLAREVIRDGARHLVGLVQRLKKRGAQASKVVAGGGVIAAQPSLARAFVEEFAARFDGSMTAEIYTGPPVEGACRIATAVGARVVRSDVSGRRTASSS